MTGGGLSILFDEVRRSRPVIELGVSETRQHHFRVLHPTALLLLQAVQCTDGTIGTLEPLRRTMLYYPE